MCRYINEVINDEQLIWEHFREAVNEGTRQIGNEDTIFNRRR